MRYALPLICLVGWSCSQFSQAPTAKIWHNTNARFNKYIIARTALKETDKVIAENRKDNFSAPFPVIFPLDSSAAKSSDAQLKEVIDKSSIIAEKHSNSKYLDRAYLMIGRARMLKGDYVNAIEIFKYVNSKSKSSTQKGEALLFLMQTYIENKDFEAALRAGEALRDAELSKSQTIRYYLVKAYLHQIREEYKVSIPVLLEAAKLMSKGQQKARTHFILGQMYESLNDSQHSAEQFSLVKKNRPAYDLEFYAQMNAIGNASDLGSSKNAELQKIFEKMLNDRKNDDLVDKIYFTMAQVEVRNKQYAKAETLFKKAIKASKGNKMQAAFSYLELAKLNYEYLLNYDKSHAYYDSALAFLPENSPEFENIRKRTIVLNEFVKYQNTIVKEDSLQKIAAMNPQKLDDYLEEAIKRIDKEEKELMEMAKSIAIANKNRNNVNNPNRWMLYDPVKLGQSKLEFQQLWGNRPLEDHWRRSQKESGGVSLRVESKKIDANAKVEETGAVLVLNSSNKMPLELRKKAMMAELPLDANALSKSNAKLEEAFYKIGKIYQLNLREPEKAGLSFRTLLQRFPNTAREPEVLYFLALIYPSENWKEKLISQYPNSSFARQIQRTETNTSNLETEAQAEYTKLFELYKTDRWNAAIVMADDQLIKYTGTKVEDKIALVRIYLLAKLQRKELYASALKDFQQSYPTSDLLKHVKDLEKSLTNGLN